MLKFIKKDGTLAMNENTETGKIEILDKDLKESFEKVDANKIKAKKEKKNEVE